MDFLKRYERVRKCRRRMELLRGRRNHLIHTDPTNRKIDAMSVAFDKADARYAEAIASLAPDVVVQSF